MISIPVDENRSIRALSVSEARSVAGIERGDAHEQPTGTGAAVR